MKVLLRSGNRYPVSGSKTFRRRIETLLFLSLLFSTGIYSQSDLVFDHITVNEGLTQSVVSAFYRDSRDYMWFGTLNGINRYDGVNIKKFESLSDDSTSLSTGHVLSIFEDRTGTLWVGTINGLNRYDYSKERFRRIYNNPEDPNSLLDNYIVRISEDSKGVLWVTTRRGMNRYNAQTDDFTCFAIPESINLKDDGYIEAAYQKNSDTVFLAIGSTVFQFQTTSISYREVYAGISTKLVNALFVDSHGGIWVGTENDGAYVIRHNGEAIHFTPGENDRSGLTSISVKSIDTDSRGNIWLSTRGGLFRLNSDGETFTAFRNESGNPNSLLSSYARTFYEDKQGIIWVGTLGGVNKYDQGRMRFRHLKTNVPGTDAESSSLYSDDNIVWSFYRDKNDYLWVGSMRTLLSSIPFRDIDKGEFTTAEFFRNGKKIIPPFNSVTDIKGDRLNNLWLATDNGLYYYNTATREIRGYMHQDDNPNALSNNVLSSICIIGDSVLWITSTVGLNRFVPSRNEFITYLNNPADTASLVNNYLFSILCEENGRLWVTGVNGLSYADLNDPASGNGRTLKFTNLTSLFRSSSNSYNQVTSIWKQSDNSYWLGTTNGIYLIDSALRVLDHLSVSDGLPNQNVNRIEGDSMGQLWISTENGITCFNPAAKSFRNFYATDGLQANEFNTNASYQDKDGNIYFGGINGFNIFYPDQLAPSDFSPGVIITSMSVLNKPLEIDKEVSGFTLTESIAETRNITLGYKQNFFSFEFAALDFTNPSKIRYKYMLEGFDDEWIVCTNERSAHYTGVEPGRYTFRVRATNADGQWSDHSASLSIFIRPPFWRTTLFYMMSGIFLLFALYFIYKYRVKALEREKKMLEEEVEKRTHELSVIYQDLKKSNSFVESVISNAPYGITVINRGGDIILANPAVSVLTGYSNSELLTMNFRDLTPEQWLVSDDRIMEALSNGEKVYNEKEYVRKDGSVIQVAISSSLIEKYDFPAYVNIISDITQRRKNESELQEYRTNLEALIEERTADLIAAKENAEKADRLKTAFLSNISHEIRTPMNSIVGFSSLLKTESCDQEQTNEYLEQITIGAHNLLNIVTNIVEISKISANDISLSSNRITLVRFINDIYTSFLAKARLKGIEFKLDYDPLFRDMCILSDESKLAASINNLLDNALKFTFEGYIRLSFSLSGNNSIEVCVEDSGIGISPEIGNDIFEPFRQADTTLSRAYGGTGLGLAIAKAYIEKTGGRIWYRSQPGRGSSFFISFPYVTCPDRAATAEKQRISSSDLNVLIVEDEDMNYFYLSEILRNQVSNIFRAYDGYSAIEMCRKNSDINLVLMDIKLPGISGLEATAEIRKFRPEMPIIAQTAYTLIGDREKAIEAGCNDYISKPINREKLYSIITSYSK